MRVFRRLLSLLVCMAMVLTLLPGVGIWTYAKSGDIAYALKGGNVYFRKSTGTITKCDATVTVAKIPSRIDGAAVKHIGDFAFRDCFDLTFVDLPDTVVSVGEGAFSGCTALRNVTLPQGDVTYYGLTFRGCTALRHIRIPQGVTSLGMGMFRGCTALERVTLPQGLREIGSQAFYHCSALKEITLPDRLTYMDSECFSGCTGLQEIRIPRGVTGIGAYAFRDCSGAESLTIGDTVSIIGSGAFRGCDGLQEVTVPKGTGVISPTAFADCTGLQSIRVEEGNEHYFSDAEGVLFNLDRTELISMPCGYSGSYTVPQTVTIIGENAFENCRGLRGITLPQGVTNIAERAFAGCTGLEELSLPHSLTHIGREAFLGCTALTGVTIPGSVTWMGNRCFSGCSALEAFRVSGENRDYASAVDGVLFNKDGTELIAMPGAYAGTYTVPREVTTIGDYAFAECRALTEVTVSGNVPCISTGAFYNCTGLTRVTLPESVRDIASDAFRNCSALGEICIPAGVTHIGDGAFRGCSALKSITIPEGVTDMENGVFYGCKGLGTLFLPQGLDNVSTGAFYECTALGKVGFGGSEKAWKKLKVLSNNLPLENADLRFEKESEPEEPIPEEEISFADVEEDGALAQAVAWAVEKGITNGTGAGNFSPEQSCTRGQIVTFLWRAAGSPQPQTTENPFTDVEEGDYFYDAVLWAVDRGITGGMGDGKFSPHAMCNRAQAAVFLWRAQGEHAPGGRDNPFKDLTEDAYYYDAVLWLVEQGISQGTAEGAFSPEGDCTRGQIVTFLYRAMGQVSAP